jgi:hypothetical protein
MLQMNYLASFPFIVHSYDYLFLSINLICVDILQAIFYCVQMCWTIFYDSRLMLKLF